LRADLVEGGHDRDGLLRRQDVAGDPASVDQALGLVRLILHAPALDGRVEVLGEVAGRVVDPQPGRHVPDAVELDAPPGADHHGHVRAWAGARRVGGGDLPARVMEHGGHLGVGAGVLEGADRLDPLRGAEQLGRERNRVHAEVEQRAAAEFEGVQPVSRVAGQQLGVVGGH
jgi:hypothetical protein